MSVISGYIGSIHPHRFVQHPSSSGDSATAYVDRYDHWKSEERQHLKWLSDSEYQDYTLQADIHIAKFNVTGIHPTHDVLLTRDEAPLGFVVV